MWNIINPVLEIGGTLLGAFMIASFGGFIVPEVFKEIVWKRVYKENKVNNEDEFWGRELEIVQDAARRFSSIAVFIVVLICIVLWNRSSAKASETYDTGYESGYQTGYTEGRDKGFEQGMEYGYEQGYDDAYYEFG